MVFLHLNFTITKAFDLKLVEHSLSKNADQWIFEGFCVFKIMANINLDNYIPVNERLGLFYKDFPNGRITTELVEHNIESGFVMFKAFAFRDREDAEASATGHAFEERTQGYVNKTSYIENCETSAVGRALALLGYEITKGIASREEMQKVQRYQKNENAPKPPQQKPPINLNDSIIKAKQELLKLDVKAEPRKQNESEQEYLDGLREQYKQRKAFLNQ